jgi:predicted nucleic acid-binding protein
MTAPVFMLDSSCMVAAVCAWHEHHAAAANAIETRFGRGEHLAVAGHALAETYAVLTRLPAPHRLAPADAWALIEANFVEQSSTVALGAAAYPKVLRRLAKQAVGGGRTYDALIAACAHPAKASALLTFNPRHFDPPPEGVSVVDPSLAG